MLVNIYELRDPRDIFCSPRYIGITTCPLKVRLGGHFTDTIHSLKPYSSKKLTYKGNWINSLLKIGIKPTIHLIEQVEGWDYAYETEKYWIKEFREQGYKLTNTTDGGKGGRGLIISKEQREKMVRGIKLRVITPEEKIIIGLRSNKVTTITYDSGEVLSFISVYECCEKLRIPRTSLQRYLYLGYSLKYKFKIKHEYKQ